MPNINVEVSEDLMVAIRVAVAKSTFTQKEWVNQVLAEASGLKKKRQPKAVEAQPVNAG